MLLGIVTGPLIWGRVVAFIMRATQALYEARRLRLACYVDDPLAIAAGTHQERMTCFAVLTLFWVTLGFRLAWPKGHRGLAVPWIGASIQLHHRNGTVELALPEAKRVEALKDIAALKAQGNKVLRRDLCAATGRLEWMAGMLPQLRPFAQMFWAALASDGAGANHVWMRQVHLAVQWFEAFLQAHSGLISRVVRADPPNTRPVIAFDASVFGGGAILWVVPATMPLELPRLHSTPLSHSLPCRGQLRTTSLLAPTAKTRGTWPGGKPFAYCLQLRLGRRSSLHHRVSL